MSPLKKTKIVTATCAVVTVCLLGLSIAAVATPVQAAETETSGENSVSVELDKEVYDGVMGMLRYYADYDSNKNTVPSEPVEDNSDDKSDDSEDKFLVEGMKLYVVINGSKYPVVETEDGLLVVESSVDDPEGIVGKDDDEGNPIIGVTPDGLPIVGYDENGEPIIGIPIGTKPIEEVIECTNPYIQVDEDGNKYYHIVWGDTLCKISSRVHYSVDELAEYNHIRNVNLIYAESDLRIPDWESNDIPPVESESKSDAEVESTTEDK